MKTVRSCLVFLGLVCGFQVAQAAPFQKVFVVIFENTNASDSLEQPFMKSLLAKGAYLSNSHAVAHPSQPNYVALTSGATQGVVDDGVYNLSVSHIGDLLEAKGHSWKSYAEGFPGKCNLASRVGNYVRKHEPFLSYTNISGNSTRCNAHIVNAKQLAIDVQNNSVPDYSFYVPDLINDGHDTSVVEADQWLQKTFGNLLQDQRFMKDMLFVVTFDENDASNDMDNNLIYTLLLGDSVKPGVTSAQQVNHYNLLRLIEDGLGLGNLGQGDVSATPITGVWK